MTPARCRERESPLLVVTALFTVASSARYQYISRNMQARPVAIHPVEVLIDMSAFCKEAAAIRATILKPLTNKSLVFLPIHSHLPILRN